MLAKNFEKYQSLIYIVSITLLYLHKYERDVRKNNRFLLKFIVTLIIIIVQLFCV